jgi:diadenosine tetraphosphate (Ap4A) HIT family hydrolase
MPDSECPFCLKLTSLAELSESEVVWQFPYSVALLGPWQFYQGYCILVARRHISELFHLTEEERQGYLDEMCTLAKTIAECFQPQKMNYELLGNQVPHLHWHLFPRYPNDPNAVQPVWLTLDRAEKDPAERQRLQTGPTDRQATALMLRQALTRLKDR